MSKQSDNMKGNGAIRRQLIDFILFYFRRAGTQDKYREHSCLISELCTKLVGPDKGRGLSRGRLLNSVCRQKRGQT